MVEELRKIILTKEEIIAAIDSYRRAVPDFLPNGEIIRCQPGEENVFSIVVKLSYGKNIQEMEFNFKFGDLLGPIVQFCVENNIVLPRNSRKCVKMENDKICLYIVMESPQIQTAAAPPQVAAARHARSDQTARA